MDLETPDLQGWTPLKLFPEQEQPGTVQVFNCLMEMAKSKKLKTAIAEKMDLKAAAKSARQEKSICHMYLSVFSSDCK